MQPNPNTVRGTFTVAVLLCLVCSSIVAAAAVFLRPLQERNEELSRKQNVLEVTGRFDPETNTKGQIEELFEPFQTILVDLNEGRLADPDEVNLDEYDPRVAAKDPKRSVPLKPYEDIAGIKQRENYAFVYLLRDEAGEIDQIVLPVYGKGLWSTLYGYVALDRDLKTIRGLTFYEHGETPGLGGEVDNPKWKSQWQGKIAYSEDWEPVVDVAKGSVDPNDPNADFLVDGLSGATITSNGVENLLRFWLGEQGFAPFLANLRSDELEIPPPSSAGPRSSVAESEPIGTRQ